MSSHPATVAAREKAFKEGINSLTAEERFNILKDLPWFFLSPIREVIYREIEEAISEAFEVCETRWDLSIWKVQRAQDREHWETAEHDLVAPVPPEDPS